MALSDIINVIISAAAQIPTQLGFGVPLILDFHIRWTDRIRFYTDLAGMTADGFLTTDAAYLAASALFAQNPRPPRIAVGRRLLAPTQSWTLVPIAKNGTDYTVTVDGHTVTYTSDATATLAEITAGLKTDIDALSLALTVSTPSNTSVHIVSNNPGDWHQVAVSDAQADYLSNLQDQADPGCATDLDAINTVDSTWYALGCTTASKAEIVAIAGWAETHNKFYLASSQDSAIITVADGSATDVAHTLKGSARFRTADAYHPDNAAFLDFGWLGRCLPLAPGSETWKFKTVSGPQPVKLTATHITNLKAKNCNFYTALAGINTTQDGEVASGEWIDVVRFRDWIVSRIQAAVFALLANSSKVPFTDKGIGLVASAVRAVLKEGVNVGGLSDNPAPQVTVPKAADVSPTNKALRNLPDVDFTATLAGAIHATTINGTITV